MDEVFREIIPVRKNVLWFKNNLLDTVERAETNIVDNQTPNNRRGPFGDLAVRQDT